MRRKGIDLSRETVWKVFVGCQVTTQQRSGPNSLVKKFLNSESPALSYKKCKSSTSIKDMIATECKNRGLRRAPTISSNLLAIFNGLETGGWEGLMKHLNTLSKNTTMAKERSVVNHLQSKAFPGLGQKQSRNFIQWLGLSRYEIPLDSRVLKKLKELGTNFVPSGAALTDEAVYIFVQDGIQQIAKILDLYPCELDACLFSSFDVTDEDEI